MARGPRIHMSVSSETYKDVKSRDGFNCSRFFETKYREEFLNEEGLKAKIELHKKELARYTDRLMGIKSEKVVEPKYDSNKCPICSMFFNESISIRKKVHIYKSLYVCQLCSFEQKELIDKQVQELKLKDQEDENAEEIKDSVV